MSNYKSAVVLGISDQEYAALLTVKEELANGHLAHCHNHWNNDQIRGKMFNMNCEYVKSKTGCGTVACIGGWMAFFMKLNPTDYVFDGRSDILDSLFFPRPLDNENISWDVITPQMAVKAIDNFLTTGEPDWLDVVKN